MECNSHLGKNKTKQKKNWQIYSSDKVTLAIFDQFLSLGEHSCEKSHLYNINLPEKNISCGFRFFFLGTKVTDAFSVLTKCWFILPSHSKVLHSVRKFYIPAQPKVLSVHLTELTQMSSWVMTTLAIAQERCRAVRPSPSPYVSLTSSLVPCASSSTTNLRSSSTTARSNCCPRGTSDWGRPTRKSFCSYLARIQRSFSSLEEDKRQGHGRLSFRWRSRLRLETCIGKTLDMVSWWQLLKRGNQRGENEVPTHRGRIIVIGRRDSPM